MVTRCANPACGATFQYLRGGRLFQVDRRQRRAAPASEAVKRNSAVEYFWLCEKCSPGMTLIVDGSGGVGVVEIQPPADD